MVQIKIMFVLGHFSQGEQERATFALDTSADFPPSVCTESADFAPFSYDSAVFPSRSADCSFQSQQQLSVAAFSNEIYDDRVWCEFRKGEGFCPMNNDPYISAATTV